MTRAKATRRLPEKAAPAPRDPLEARLEQIRAAWERMGELLPGDFPDEDAPCLEAWIDFEGMDAPAFRAGYLSERLSRAFQRVPASLPERRRLLALALREAAICAPRRELADLGWITAQLGGATEMEGLTAIFALAAEPPHRYKAGSILLKLLGLHPELRPACPIPLAALEREILHLRREHWERHLRPRIEAELWIRRLVDREDWGRAKRP